MARTRGFTLIELLVVIAIIAIIAAILFPVFARARGKGWQANCLSNLKQLGAAVMMYMQDNDDTFPVVLNFSANITIAGGANVGDNGQVALPGFTGQERQFQLVTVVAPYVRNTNVWYCPTVGPDATWEAAVKDGAWKKGAKMRDQGTTYSYTYTAWPYQCWRCPGQILMGGKKGYAILRESSRWPMISEQPQGYWYTGSLADPPPSVMPHFGGLNVAYGDGHAKFHRMEQIYTYVLNHAGDGIFQ